MPRIEEKEEAKEEKKEKSGAWEKKKIPHAPNRGKTGSQGRKKGRERGMGKEKRSPMPRIEIKEEAKQEKKKEKDHFQSTYW